MIMNLVWGLSAGVGLLSLVMIAIFIFYFVKTFIELHGEWMDEQKRLRRAFENQIPPLHDNCRCELRMIDGEHPRIIDWDDPHVPAMEVCDEDEYTDEFFEHLMATEWALREVIEEIESREDDELDSSI